MSDAAHPIGETQEVTLASLVRASLAENPDVASPGEVAAKVLAKVPIGAERRFLSSLLRGYVAEQIRRIEGVPTSDLDPDAAWLGLLRDRVPTAAGYRFLADADAPSLSAGAERRRLMARNLTARAEVYDAIAEQITKAGVSSAGELVPATAAEAVRAVHDPLRELAQMAPAEIVQKLWTDDRALRIAVVAHARRNIPVAVDEALQLPEMADRWHTALQAEISARSAPPPGEGTLRRLERDALIQVRQELRHRGVRLRGQSDATVDRLESLPPSVMAKHLLTHRQDLTQMALADARSKTPPHVRNVLRRDDVLPAFIACLEQLQYNLNQQVERGRVGTRAPKNKAWDDRRAVIRRLREVRSLHAQSRAETPELDRRQQLIRQSFNSWELSVISKFKPEIIRRHNEALAEHGLSLPPSIPRKGIVMFALEQQVLGQPPERVAEVLLLTDDQFRVRVGEDVNGKIPQPLLRSDWLLDRWRTALLELKAMAEDQRDEADEDLRRRRTRFVMGINSHLSEQRRLELALRDRVFAEIDRRDTSKDERWLLWDEICREVIARCRREELYGASE